MIKGRYDFIKFKKFYFYLFVFGTAKPECDYTPFFRQKETSKRVIQIHVNIIGANMAENNHI